MTLGNMRELDLRRQRLRLRWEVRRSFQKNL